MYRTVIIDDDPLIRKGLIRTVNWGEYDFEVVGEAGDGLSGAELIENISPDLIITDIRMPGLDGFEMIDRIRKTDPDSEILIITAFRNFEYAKQALGRGARDLLLKPTKPKELKALLVKIGRDLKKKDDIKRELRQGRELFEKHIPLLRVKYVHDLIFGLETWNKETRERLEFLDLGWKSFYLLSVGFSFLDENKDAYERYLSQFSCGSMLERLFKEEFPCVNAGIRAGRLYAVIGIGSEDKSTVSALRSLCEQAIDIAEKNLNMRITIALSARHKDFGRLRTAYREASLAMERSFFIGSGTLIEYDGRGPRIEDDSPFCADELDDLLCAIKAGNKQKVEKWFAERESTRPLPKSVDIVKGRYWDMVSRIIAGRRPPDDGKILPIKPSIDLFAKIYKSQSVDELNRIIFDLALEIADESLKNQQKGIARIVDKAKKYIEEHYGEELTLPDVADQVFVSSSYLSRIFKKAGSINFSEYVNQVRVDHAKELLADGELMTYQVGDMVGYSDPHYFSRIFKKITGHSPSYYRGEKE